MDTKIDNICRLCLKAEGTDFLLLDEYRTTKLKVIIPQLTINESGNLMICTKCKDSLDASYSLKKTISDNEDLIRARKNKLGIFDKVGLDQIFNDSTSSHEGAICRICLNSNDNGNVKLDSVPSDASFYQVLQTCLTDMKRDLTADPVVCETCISKMCDMHAFITATLAVEEKIKEYCESDPGTKNSDANDVLAIVTRELAKSQEETNDFLAEFEVQDEEGTDIFDSIPNISPSSISQSTSKENNVQWKSDYDSNRKRSSEVPNDDTPKKPKTVVPQTTEEITSDELPHFKFNFQLVYNTKMGMTVADFLSTVDMYKHKYNWSDNMAIQKVLLRLQAIPDLHTWFSSIGDILTWDEWRNKLLKAFPTDEDYSISLKKALNRKKRPTETFADYCKDKAALLARKNITGEDAVSCIVQGLPFQDILVYCLARIGNYQTTEELLEYFERCDEKYSVADITPSQESEKEKTVPKPQERTDPTTVDWKNMKGKCFLCSQSGHLAIECTKSHNTVAASKFIQKQQATAATKHQTPSPQTTKVDLTLSLADQKRKRVRPAKCTYCNKFGHKTGVCPHAKLAELRRSGKLDDLSKSRKSPLAKCVHCGQTNHASFNCPRPSSRANRSAIKPAARTPPNKGGIRGSQAQIKPGNRTQQSPALKKEKCLYCNKMGHRTAQCRLGRKQVRRESAVQKCTTCGELGHSHCQHPQIGASSQQQERRVMTEAEKFAAASRMALTERPIVPDRRDRQTADLCQYCGSGSHLSSACYYANNTEENYMSKVAEPAYKQLLCFKCYKIGHHSDDCPRVDTKWAAHRK